MKRISSIVLVWSIVICAALSAQTAFGQVPDNKVKNELEAAKKQASTDAVEEPEGISEQTRQNIKKVEDAQVAFVDRSDDRYRIGFQDTLDVQVFRHPELSQTVAVNPDGTIRLFRIDNPIVAVCKTERELAYTIETLYKNYLRTPQVNVRAIEQRSQPFSIMGAVEKPGMFFLNKKVRLIQLLSMAGGFDVENAGMKIQVARIGDVSGCGASVDSSNTNDVEFLTFNLADVLEGRQNPWMEPGDIVSVLKAEEAYVVGDVVEPTKVELKAPITLTQAIAIAKGLDRNAKTDNVVIQRQVPGSPVKTEIAYNLKDIRDKKIPDPLLQANDIVVVSTDRGKAITNSLVKALTGGLGNLFYRFPL